MKKGILSLLFYFTILTLLFAAPAQRTPESCRDSTPSLKDSYARYFMIGASCYADSEEDVRIKDKEKEEKKQEKAAKKQEKADKKKKKTSSSKKKQKKAGSSKSSKNSESSDDSDRHDSFDYEDYDDSEDDDSYNPKEKSSFFIKTAGKHFAELSSGNELLPYRLLGKKPKKLVQFTASDGYSYDVPAKWNSKYLTLFLEDAKKAGVQVRFHLLLCPEMTPEWFFFRGYDTAGRLVGIDEMNARIEWYIKQVTVFISDWEYEHNNGKSLVTSYDVLSELFTDTGGYNMTPSNYLMKIYGDDHYAIKAFAFASNCVPESVKLCYCDHTLFEKKKAEKVKTFISSVRSEGKGRVDQIGIISHLTTDWPDRKSFFATCKDLYSAGLEVQIQQLDISAMKAKDSSKAYYEFMKDCIENSDYIQGVSFRAVKAAEETDFEDYMRAPLFSSDYSCTANFDQVIQAGKNGISKN
ncbi:MAG: endo-1,4-beta-xylanase [Treponema sp.]|nr:endo-1,4-beta-xylanase [Treponema sp.]